MFSKNQRIGSIVLFADITHTLTRERGASPHVPSPINQKITRDITVGQESRNLAEFTEGGVGVEIVDALQQELDLSGDDR